MANLLRQARLTSSFFPNKPQRELSETTATGPVARRGTIPNRPPRGWDMNCFANWRSWIIE